MPVLSTVPFVIMVRRRGSYGVDAPYALFGLACAVVGTVFAGIGVTFGVGIEFGWIPFAVAAFNLVSVALYLHATWRGKFAVWHGLLDDLGLRGDERLLDLGCGRGAVLLLAAERLPKGRAVGVDLWRSVDQSGNAISVTEGNAEAEGVRDRVELRTGDMTALPFGDASFDVIVSSLAVHNIKGADGRARAIDEAVRVLRPGGRLLIADISAADAYRRRLTELGLADVRLRPLGWRMWWGGPWMSTRAVSAVKPA
ncbi:class I SAM-dependent methyltransferase [Actinoallomurus sp. NBC_01490]|uniref:class I SAM-dependent methyltransferase n=1 Tax=Actinoallomurus sp. NBC_01490 TaxID=2903557 RepID=UPI002E3287E0|nr:class I SAM-dependent methyltransferase [Actinoallomurus sp. NBC_01490]